MYILVFAALFGWAATGLGMHSYNFSHEHSMHLQDVEFIQSSNTPLTVAASLNDCKDCMATAVEQAKSKVSYWSFFKWRPSDDMFYAIWNCVSNKQKAGQLCVLLRNIQYREIFKVKRGGRSLFFHAVACHNLAAVQEIFHSVFPHEKSMLINEVSDGGQVYSYYTPLMLAVHQCKDENITDNERIIEALLSHGACVNARREETKDTALLLAQTSKVADMLIDHGAYIDDKDYQGKTVFDVVAQSGNINGPHIGTLIKKILINGILRPMKGPNHCIKHIVLGCTECPGTVDSLKEKIDIELTLQELLKLFNHARLPRDIQLNILQRVPWFTSFYSKSTLAVRGPRIDSHWCRIFFRRVPDSVIFSVAQSLQGESRREFANIFIPVLMDLRCEHLWQLFELNKYFMYHMQAAGYYRNECAWPPKQLIADLKEYYEQGFWVK